MDELFEPSDNTRVAIIPILPRRLIIRRPLDYIQDSDKVKYYLNLLNFTNNNFFNYGRLTNFDPTTPEGQTAIESNFNYAKGNALDFMSNISGAGAASAASKVHQTIKGPFRKLSPRGNLGALKLYTRKGVIGQGAEAVVIENNPITVGKITTIPVEEMISRNNIPHTIPSRYIGYVRSGSEKLPTYILRRVKVLTDKTFPKYLSKLDKAMLNKGFTIVNDPTVQYRAYTNGLVVIDDIAPGNVGVTLFGLPKLIDFNLLSIPEWIELGFKLRKGGKLI